MTMSALEGLFLNRTEKFRDRYPHPEQVAGQKRVQMYNDLTALSNQARLNCYLIEKDSIRPLRNCEMHHHHEYPGTKIWQVDFAGNFSSTHYAPTYVHLLQKMEEDTSSGGKIIPGKTTMIEVTTGSAGTAFGHVGRLVGYPRELIAPQEIRQWDPARWAVMEEAIRGDSLEGTLIPTEENGAFLAGAVTLFRKRLVEVWGGKKGLHEGRYAIPNHSMVTATIEATRAMGRRAIGLLEKIKVWPEALVLGIGNGTSTEGIFREFQERYRQVLLWGYQGCCNPGAFQQLMGRQVPDDMREDRVTLYGIDGTGNLETNFPAIQRLGDLKQQGYLRDILLISRDESEAMFETLNQGCLAASSQGKSSAAGIVAAARVARSDFAREQGIRNIVTWRYDTAIPYGAALPQDSCAVYQTHGVWRHHNGFSLPAEEYVMRLSQNGKTPEQRLEP